MKKLLFSISLLLCTFLSTAQQLEAGYVTTWSVGEITFDCDTRQICYPINVRSSDPNTFLSESTLRFIYDSQLIDNPVYDVVLPANDYIVTQNLITNPAAGDEFGFTTDDAEFLRLQISPNASNLIEIGLTPTYVFTICFDYVGPGSVDPNNLCAPLVFDTVAAAGTGIQNDVGFFTNDAGNATTYTNSDFSDNFGGDDEADQFLWTEDPGFDGTLNTSGETVGSVSSTNCIMTGCSTLPIELGSFTASPLGLDADLKWTTITEENNSHFEIERSVDGINFEFVERIESQAVNGNSQFELSYTFLDKNAINHDVLGQGIYYRIKQVDQEIPGQVINYAYTPVRLVIFEELIIGEGRVFPNPVIAGEIVNVQYDGIERIEIFNLQGELVQVIEEIGLPKTTSIGTGNMARGVYLVLVNGKKTMKFVVQ